MDAETLKMVIIFVESLVIVFLLTELKDEIKANNTLAKIIDFIAEGGTQNE